MRIRVLDLLILLLALISLVSYFSQYGEYHQKEKLEYSGSQIFKAIRDFDNYASKGFLYTVQVEGRLNMDDSLFEDTGFVVETGRGYFVLKNYEGDTYTVGGVMSYKEDISAERITMEVKNKSTVFYLAKPIETKEFKDLKTQITTISSFMAFKEIDDIAITGEITVVPSTDLSGELPSIIYCRSSSLDGTTLTVEQLSMREMESLDTILEPTSLYTGDLWVIIRTGEEIKELEKYEITKWDDENPQIYEDSIHIRL